jgi:hypothetical protein
MNAPITDAKLGLERFALAALLGGGGTVIPLGIVIARRAGS